MHPRQRGRHGEVKGITINKKNNVREREKIRMCDSHTLYDLDYQITTSLKAFKQRQRGLRNESKTKQRCVRCSVTVRCTDPYRKPELPSIPPSYFLCHSALSLPLSLYSGTCCVLVFFWMTGQRHLRLPNTRQEPVISQLFATGSQEEGGEEVSNGFPFTKATYSSTQIGDRACNSTQSFHSFK